MTDRKKCPYCGRELHSDAQFCIYCMQSLQPKTDVTPPPPRRKSFPLWIVMLLFVLLVILLMIWGKLWNSNSGDKNSPNKVKSSVSTEHDEDVTHISETPAPKDEPVATEDVVTESGQTEPDNIREETEPEETQAETEPMEAVPTETPPVLCNHAYQQATCLLPMTCTLCGVQRGETDENAHRWEAITATVYHEEKGHYEDVTDAVKKIKYLCFFCGYNQTGFDSMDEVREHITVHSASSNYDMIVSYPDMLTETREVWDTVSVKTWIVDQEAYEETIVEGYSCAICGKTKDHEFAG